MLRIVVLFCAVLLSQAAVAKAGKLSIRQGRRAAKNFGTTVTSTLSGGRFESRSNRRYSIGRRLELASDLSENMRPKDKSNVEATAILGVRAPDGTIIRSATGVQITTADANGKAQMVIAGHTADVLNEQAMASFSKVDGTHIADSRVRVLYRSQEMDFAVVEIDADRTIEPATIADRRLHKGELTYQVGCDQDVDREQMTDSAAHSWLHHLQQEVVVRGTDRSLEHWRATPRFLTLGREYVPQENVIFTRRYRREGDRPVGWSRAQSTDHPNGGGTSGGGLFDAKNGQMLGIRVGSKSESVRALTGENNQGSMLPWRDMLTDLHRNFSKMDASQRYAVGRIFSAADGS